MIVFLTHRTQVRVRLARRARVAGIHGAGRVHRILQLPGSFRLRGRIVAEVFRRLVLLRRHRAGQPEPGPVLGVGVHHVLRAPAQSGLAGRHGARAGVHPGDGSGQECVAVRGRQVLLGRHVGRVRRAHMVVHGGRAGGRHTFVQHKRVGTDSRLQPGHVPVLRSGTRLRSHRSAARSGSRGPSRAPVAGRARGPSGPGF